MKIDLRDLALFGQSKEALRDALSCALDAASAQTIERLTGGDADDALFIIDEVGKLNTLLAANFVWNQLYTSVESVLSHSNAPTLAAVIALTDAHFGEVMDSTVLRLGKPEFFPYLIVAYGVAIQHLRKTDKMVTFAEDICKELDETNGWEYGTALDALKDEEPDIITQVAEIAARRGIEQVGAKGMTPEQIERVRTLATKLGVNPDNIGLPQAIQLHDQEVTSRPGFLEDLLAQMSKSHGYQLNPAHLQEYAPGKFRINVGPDGKSWSEAEQRDAELDGGSDNIPRAETEPRDDADGVDRRPQGAALDEQKKNSALHDFITQARFPAAARDFGVRTGRFSRNVRAE